MATIAGYSRFMKWWLVVGLVGVVASGCGDNGTAPLDATPGSDAPCGASLTATPSQLDLGTVRVTTSQTGTVAIASSGTCATRSLTLSLTGTNAGEFAIASSSCAGMMLAPGDSCTIDVRFEPTTMGAKSASLMVDGADAPVSVALAAAASTGGSALVASPTVIDFGQTAAPGTKQTVTVTNTAGVTTGVLATSLAGSNPTSYAIENDTCSGATLAAAASCSFQIATTCTNAGLASTAIAAVNANPGGVTSVAIGGKVAASSCSAVLAVSPTQKDFGAQRITTTGTAQTFTFTNVGGRPSTALAATLSGTDSTQFTLSNDACTGVLLAPGSSCTVDVAFSPTVPGARSAEVRVDGTASATLVGTAVTGGGGLAVSPAMIDFGTSAMVGAKRTVTITNTGGASTGTLSTSLAGADASSFAIANDGCAASALLPGASCTFEIWTTCIGTGAPRTASVTTMATPGGVVTAAIGGTVVATVCDPDVLSPTTISFGSQPVGSTSTSQTVRLQNSGGLPYGPLATSLGGPNASQFELTADTCTGTTLSPGAACTASVAFRPTSTGAKNASVTVSGPAGSTSTSLSGQGVAGALELSPSTYDFGSASVGWPSAAKVFTLTNNAAVPTSALAVAITGEFQITADGCSGTQLVSGASCAIAARFAPTSLGNTPKVGELSATASTGGTARSMLTGVAVSGPHLIVTPALLSFPATAVGAASTTMSLTVSWTGGQGQMTGALATSLFGSAFGDFTIDADTCTGMQLGANGQCTLGVSFHPTATGPRQASIEINAVPGGNVAAGLQGTGQ